jgi:hypothetical protein
VAFDDVVHQLEPGGSRVLPKLLTVKGLRQVTPGKPMYADLVDPDTGATVWERDVGADLKRLGPIR